MNQITPLEPVAKMNEHEAATFLGTSVFILRNLRYRNEGPSYYKIGLGPKARVRYRAEDLQAWNDYRTCRIESNNAPA